MYVCISAVLGSVSCVCVCVWYECVGVLRVICCGAMLRSRNVISVFVFLEMSRVRIRKDVRARGFSIRLTGGFWVVFGREIRGNWRKILNGFDMYVVFYLKIFTLFDVNPIFSWFRKFFIF